MAASPEIDAPSTDIAAIAAEIFATLGTAGQIAPFTSRPAGLSIADAYRVSAALHATRQARGEKPLGRKIGFTNRTIWHEYGVYAPIWGYVYDSTVHDLAAGTALPLAGFAEPRIEPEIVFGLSAAPAADMDETALLSCLEWAAHGFEIVQSIYPHWKFAAADTVAANGVHGALLIGPRHAIGPRAGEWQTMLSRFDIDLSCDGRHVDRGNAANVLAGPLAALRHLVGLLSHDRIHPPLAAGEIVTTGTLTRAMPIRPGNLEHIAPRHPARRRAVAVYLSAKAAGNSGATFYPCCAICAFGADEVLIKPV
jgi:2-keto-4-pentenoate hydratase